MDLYLVRHGESNIPNDAVQSDYPFSPLGEEQAVRLGERFRGLHIDHLITTPYRRTQQTAAAIAATTDVTLVEEPGLGAIDAGELTRVPFSQRRERWPDFWVMFSIDHTAVTMLDVRHDRPRVRYVNDSSHLGNLSRGHSGRFGGEAAKLRPR
jgi:broad specificity phosphatase PhoE